MKKKRNWSYAIVTGLGMLVIAGVEMLRWRIAEKSEHVFYACIAAFLLIYLYYHTHKGNRYLSFVRILEVPCAQAETRTVFVHRIKRKGWIKLSRILNFLSDMPSHEYSLELIDAAGEHERKEAVRKIIAEKPELLTCATGTLVPCNGTAGMFFALLKYSSKELLVNILPYDTAWLKHDGADEIHVLVTMPA